MSYKKTYQVVENVHAS